MEDNSFVDFIDESNSCSNTNIITYPVATDNTCHRDNYDDLYYRKQKVLDLLAEISGGTFYIADSETSTIKTWSSKKISDMLDDVVDTEVITELQTDVNNVELELQLLKNVISVSPTYSAPTANITSSPSNSNLEIGQTINVTITTNFNKNDAGNLSSISVKKDGNIIGTASPFVDSNVVMTVTPKNYQSSVSYMQGPIKNNNLGVPDSTGQIQAGTVNSNSVSYRGYYFIPFGASTSNITTSAQARSLPQNQLSSGSNTLNLIARVGMLYQFIFVPADKALDSVVDIDALNLNITSEYEKVSDTFSINDIGGTPRTYKAYMRKQDVSYTTDHTHRITLRNI